MFIDVYDGEKIIYTYLRNDNMRNPLSYVNQTIFTGKEINDWCYSQLHKSTSYAASEARRLLSKHYKDDRLYVNELANRNTGCGSPLMITFRRLDDA